MSKRRAPVSGIVLTKGYEDGRTAAAFTPVVIISPNTPPEIVTVLLSILAPRLWMVPTWCNEIVVRYDASLDSDNAAEIEPQTEYRKACLSVGPSFLQHTAGERIDILVHELAHLLVAPLHSWCNIVMETSAYEAKSSAQQMLEETFRLALESATEDLMRTLNEAQERGEHG